MKQVLNDLIKEFYPYAKQQLGFQHPAKIVLKKDLENARDPLGKTAYYDPSNKVVYLHITGRHPKDVLRSLAHELVHHKQNCEGALQQAGEANEGYAQKDPHLREMEREAYEKGNLIFRDWEDQRKSKQTMKESKEKEPNPLKRESANDHYVKRAEDVFKELTDRWGFGKKQQDEKKPQEEQK